jgi:broad specificity phosphatase PhoE
VRPDPSQTTVFVIAALIAVGVVILVALIWPLANKLFFFDWPPLYEWQQARRPLRRIDQWRVIWATDRHHLARRAGLTEAQLAYARYRQARAQRALDRRRRRQGWGVVALVGHGIAVAGFAALAAAHSQQRAFYSLLAASQALGALGTVLGFPGSLSRQVKRMARLQSQIEDRAQVGHMLCPRGDGS